MLELLLTSFLAVLRYFQLKRRGEAITVWNMRTAVFAWAVLAFLLFLVIFYFHPNSYSGLLPFRTISVVAQTGGPVTEIAVANNQRVAAGDLLFRIEDSSQRAGVRQAEAEFDRIAADETRAEDNLKVAQARVDSTSSSLEKLLIDRDNAQRLLDRNVGTMDSVRQLEASVAMAQAELDAAEAQVHLARSDLEESIPAQRKVAEAALESARADLAKTEVRAFSDGFITQLALSMGSPAMVIIPDRLEDVPLRFTAGFNQVARSALYVGIPAELACNTNINLSFRDAILPARISGIQPAIASGQVVPGGRLLEAEDGVRRGSLLVYLELMYPEHERDIIDGSGCLVQTYTDDLDGFSGHVIAATGVVKAAGLRLKAWGAMVSGVGLGGGGH